ncbi:histidine phosphatase family protein [Aureimonas sp. AU4]|uniref:histidine phosphatase family protein n=1 Tax=Aureimonas sp. AU4 TaxID=1638163 RepID=UPI000785501A|nr:histidine phosphatase family protein [Aureimonas sp. AU4]
MPNGTLLYLCRHGQTDWNAVGRLQGQSDIPLNDRGREQARRNGRTLRERLTVEGLLPDFISSPMVRAVETMQIVRGEMGLAADGFATDERLREINFGDWQGYEVPELRRRDRAAVQRRDADKWGFLPPGDGAESYEMLTARVVPFFRELARPTLVVAHGGVMRSFLSAFCGMASDEAAHVGIPQDRILRFENGRYDWV